MCVACRQLRTPCSPENIKREPRETVVTASHRLG